MTIHIPGYTTLTGNPITLVRLIQDNRRFDADEPLEVFIETLQRDIWRLENKTVQVSGDTLEERADSLLREMAKAGLINIIAD